MTVAISHRRSAGHPDLYLVPPLEADDADDSGGARGVRVPRQRYSVDPMPDRTSPMSDRSSALHGRRPVRLTRRGRVVLGVLLLGAAIALAVLLAPATQAAAPAGPDRAVVVHTGDTLWSIATAALPGEDPYQAVDEVRVLNHLPDNRIYVGEQIVLPPA
jgi:LysM repeat protein